LPPLVFGCYFKKKKRAAVAGLGKALFPVYFGHMNVVKIRGRAWFFGGCFIGFSFLSSKCHAAVCYVITDFVNRMQITIRQHKGAAAYYPAAIVSSCPQQNGVFLS